MIDRMVREMGKRWAEIARRLGQRSDNAVKNWWNGSQNRRRRLHIQHDAHSSRSRPYTGPQQPLPFTRPAGPTSLNIPPQRRHTDTPMISPSASESSDVPPSLVADHGSNTTSPYTHSPTFELQLPPLLKQERRPSLPELNIGSHFLTVDEVQALSTLSAPIVERKAHETTTGLGIRPEYVTSDFPRDRHFPTSRHQVSQSLPSIHSVVHEPEQTHYFSPPLHHSTPPPSASFQSSPPSPEYLASSPSRDTRMNVSNLMC